MIKWYFPIKANLLMSQNSLSCWIELKWALFLTKLMKSAKLHHKGIISSIYSGLAQSFSFFSNGENKTQWIQLSLNQKEADTKLKLYASEALSSDSNSKVIIRSHSGDTDILILAMGLFIEDSYCLIIDSNTGKGGLILNLEKYWYEYSAKEMSNSFSCSDRTWLHFVSFSKNKDSFWGSSNHRFIDMLSAFGKCPINC